MATESIKNPSKTLTKHYESYGVNPTLIAGTALQQNQQVYISGNNTVSARTAGNQFPIGVVTVGAVQGDQVAIQANILRDSLAIAKGGTLNAGTFVKPNGNVNADGVPEYVACATGDFANAIVVSGGAVNAEIKVYILRSTHVVA